MINYSQKLRLRKIQKKDQKYFLKWWKDNELIRLTSGVYEKSNKVLGQYFLTMLKEKNNNYFLITYDGKPIGNVSLVKLENRTFEIQIVIGEKEFWSRGLGTIAIKKALKIAFNRLGYKKGNLEVRKNNIRAIKAYQNCGFKENGSMNMGKNKKITVLKMELLKKDFLKEKLSTR